MPDWIETPDEDDDDGTAALYKDNAPEEVDAGLDDDETDEPLDGADEDEDEEIDEERE